VRLPRFSKGPWKHTLTLGNGAHWYRIVCKRGYVATVETLDDARLIAQAPTLYESLDTLAMDVRRLLDREETTMLVTDRAWLEQGLRRIETVLNEVDGK